MKMLKSILSGAVIAFTVSSCFIDVNDDGDLFGRCINGEGPIVSQDLFVDPIVGIDLNLPATVYIIQGDDQKITVEGKENIIDRLDLDVRDRIWEIETSRCVRDVDQLTFFITLPRIEYLKISGSGEIRSEDFLVTDDIELYISGSGDIDLGLESDDIDSKISGSGTIKLEGIADNTKFEISGSGDYKAFDLESNSSYIEIRGSGDAEVNVLNTLDVKIAGSGDVFYKGNPTLNVEITGSGDVVNAN